MGRSYAALKQKLQWRDNWIAELEPANIAMTTELVNIKSQLARTEGERDTAIKDAEYWRVQLGKHTSEMIDQACQTTETAEHANEKIKSLEQTIELWKAKYQVAHEFSEGVVTAWKRHCTTVQLELEAMKENRPFVVSILVGVYAGVAAASYLAGYYMVFA